MKTSIVAQFFLCALCATACKTTDDAGAAGQQGGAAGSAGAGGVGGSAGAGGVGAASSGGSGAQGGSGGNAGGQAGGGNAGTAGSSGAAGSSGGGGEAGQAGGGQGGQGGNAGSGGAAGNGGGGFGGMLTECTDPSIDRLKSWLASGEGTTVPPTGTLLVQEGTKYVAKVEFVGAEWHVIPVLVGNVFESQANFSASSGFQLTYSATADFYVQLRPASAWDGGAKYLIAIPSTNGAIQTAVFPFDAAKWTTLPELGSPDYPFAQALGEVRGLVFVGKTPNVIAFHGLRIDGYVPPCDALPKR